MTKPLSPMIKSLFFFFLIMFAAACSRSLEQAEQRNETQVPSALQPEASQAPTENADPGLLDKVRNEHWMGDIDGMLQRRYIRAIVFYNKTNFFYDGPQARGISYDALKEFERFLNKRLQTGKTPVNIVFIPATREEGLKRMQDGRGDIAVGNIPIMAELEKIVDFSDPLRENSKQLVVGGPTAAAITIIDDLAGKEIFIRKFSRYWLTLEKLNETFKREGKQPIILREADPNLEDEDLLNMVAVGDMPMTMTDDLTAGLWAKVFPELNVYDSMPLVTDDRMGWAVQNGARNFLALVNEFVKEHKAGTSFGNQVLATYLQNTKWARNNIAPSEMEKFMGAVAFFKRYGDLEGFDWRLIAAQAYQESQIDQSRLSPTGAVGVMQIKPGTAAGDPVNITNVDTNMENNIHAGTKYLNYIMTRYFSNAKLTSINRSLFAFASYNAGPAKIAKLRKTAENEGFDPNVWFGNVELIAAREIGPETVTYVSNIYKYYVAYKMASEVVNSKTGSVRKSAAERK